MSSVGSWFLCEQKKDDAKIEVPQHQAWNVPNAKKQKSESFVICASRSEGIDGDGLVEGRTD
jgi:hypothetical protein